MKKRPEDCLTYTLLVLLTKEDHDEIVELAAASRVPRTQILRDAVELYLARARGSLSAASPPAREARSAGTNSPWRRGPAILPRRPR